MCPVCARRAAEVGVLCGECAEELAGPIHLTPEQIQARGERTPTRAALIDRWGRAHRVAVRAQIGRDVDADGDGLAVLESSVSRSHAELAQTPTGWTVRDLGSANGTWLHDRRIDAPAVIADGDRVRFGHLGFYWIDDATALPEPRGTSRTATRTLEPRPELSRELASEAPTEIGLPEIHVRLHEPTGGGGGMIEIDRKRVQLTATQLELMAILVRRMADEGTQPEPVRGFVRSAELMADLSWDTREPTENHVKQLVRRVRRVLIKAEIGDLIESRHRFGYRLRAVPVPE